ncbi:complement decay-accelerating factor isoform X2 [Labrus mixtus]|uniref:complement decay-accelerating factor isoform X2 n=1 Tax=Labrus mixtus TaxID=508554 RepID=UPI0029C08139|nr:complement decay-accelerating factor isoform X2 [Labrus mixtus]
MDVLLNTCGRKRVQTVLFVFLLVVNAAAECPKPEGKESIILSEAALLMNDFPEGSDVTLECGNGFELDSGSGVITCIDGKWTEPDLICKKRDCGPPTPMPNMSFRLSEGTLFRAVAIVICDKGYRVIGSSYKQCFALGWSGRAKCEIITCSKPGGVTNGRSSWDSQDEPKYGETVQYVCDQGFSLTGNDSIMCTETGEYDAEPPKCEGVSTGDRITMTMFTPTPATTEQGGDILTTLSPIKDTTQRDTTVTSSATNPPPSLQGGRGIVTGEDKDTPTAVASTTSSQDMHGATDEISQDNGHLPVIISVICTATAVFLVLIFINKYIMRRKGSYDTREDLKPELLQFQNL